jgi:hypothetical protein
MSDLKTGDKVRIKDRSNWPTPPGYPLANSEGIVVGLWETEEATKDFPDYVNVRIDKTKSWAEPGTTLVFRRENLEKIQLKK